VPEIQTCPTTQPFNVASFPIANRIARINAVGFPNVIQSGAMLLGQSGVKFAKLMHDLTYEHGGAVLGLNRDNLDHIDRQERGRYPTPPPRPPLGRGTIIRFP